MNDLKLPWLAEIGFMTWRTISKEKRPPIPSELLATFVVFGAFSLIPDQRVRTLMGWGIVIATALNLLGSGDLLLHPFSPGAAGAQSTAPLSPPLPIVRTPGGNKAQ